MIEAIIIKAGSSKCVHELQEGDVRQLFAPFGQITSVSIMKDNNGQSQGYGYVEFSSMPDASKAMQQWDGQEVVGQKLSVKVANMGPASIMPQLDLDDDEGKAHSSSSATAVVIHFCSARNVAHINGSTNSPQQGSPLPQAQGITLFGWQETNVLVMLQKPSSGCMCWQPDISAQVVTSNMHILQLAVLNSVVKTLLDCC